MLSIVATPLGNPDDLSLRALQILKNADVIICESTKETSKLLRHHGLSGKRYEVLNEHTRSGDFSDLVKLAQDNNCVLVSDCGTPGFCDPGSDLVRALRKRSVPIQILPGPSAIAALLSVSGVKNSEFLFIGFVPAETEARERKWRDIQSEMAQRSRPFVIMDTPYRLSKTLDDLARHFPKRKCVMIIDVSLPSEMIVEDYATVLREQFQNQKAEFMIWVSQEK
jgi:16S rRNA (cytidine1402-2'-O)-methyltransferase